MKLRVKGGGSGQCKREVLPEIQTKSEGSTHGAGENNGEVDALKPGINFNGSLGGSGEHALGTLAGSAQAALGTLVRHKAVTLSSCKKREENK